jgi:hypothetical protein
MLALLPLAAYLAIFWIFRLRGERWRSSALGAATCWGVFLALSTEIMSVPRLITRPVLSFAWFFLTLGAGVYAWKIRRKLKPGDSEGLRNQAPLRQQPFKSVDWFLLAGLGALVGLIGVTAILSAPNTWDAMAYHMSRVALWMTNRDVNLYPAFYSAQLFLSPWAEYAILHLDVLYGSDRLVNLVEFASMAGTLVGVSLIAQHFGASRRGQLFAALACATLPEGILEASGAMNTYVGAFWIVVTVYFLLRWNERQTWKLALAIGAALGLAVLTKGTAYLFLPCIIVTCWWMGSSRARKQLLMRAPVILLIFLALNGPLYARNYRMSGSPLGFSSPLGDDPERQYANSHFSPSVTVASMVKNLALHAGTPSDAVNRRINSCILGIFRILRIDPNDKASTYRGGFHLNGPSSHEARAGNPLQLALICLAGLLIVGSKIGNRNLRLYLFGLLGSFTLFCAFIRWQPWNSRYHLPLFALGLAVMAVAVERFWPRFVVPALALLLLASAAPFVLLNSIRPLAPWMPTSILREPRLNSYFADSHRWWIHSYISAAEFVEASSCDSIGIDSSLEDFDYPMLMLLGAGHTTRQVRYAGVENLTSKYARPDSKVPCAVICLRCASAPAKWAEYKQIGGKASVFDDVTVFSEQGSLVNTEDFIPPTAAFAAQTLQELDDYREAPHGINLGSTEARVRGAGRDWPSKRADLKDRLDALYTNGLTLWRVRDSVDPMRRKGEPIDHAKIDPLQLMAASEVFTSWNQTLPNRASELNGLVNQLYSSWETNFLGIMPSDTPDARSCRVKVKTITTYSAGMDAKNATTRENSIEIPECSCLGRLSGSGTILARKPFGSYDSEFDNRTSCKISASVFSQQGPDDTSASLASRN